MKVNNKSLQVNNNNLEDADKVTEQALRRSLFSSVLVIMLCLILLSTSTWAWFGTDFENKNNVISSAMCDVSIVVTSDGGDTLTGDKDDKYVLLPGSVYTVNVDVTGTSTTGYCAIKVNDSWLVSQQIKTGTSIEFTLSVTSTCEVVIADGWGTSAVPLDSRTFYDEGVYVDFAKV